MSDAPPGFAPVDAPPGFTPIKSAPVKSAVPAKGGDEHGPLVGGVLDTLGVTERPGARTPVGTVLRPHDWKDVAAREMVLAPLTVTSLPVRVGAQAGLGALEALTNGKSLGDAGWAALLDGAVAGVTEGALGYVGSKAAKLAKPLLDSREASALAQRAFKWATEAPEEALKALRARMPAGKWLNVPSISGAKLSAKEAVEELKKLTGDEYRLARDEIASELSKFDLQRLTGPKPVAGTVFKQRTSPERFTPATPPPGTGVQRGAEKVAEVAKSPITRAVTDTAATIPADDMTDIPIGGMPIMGAIRGAGDAWHYLKSKALH